MNIPVRKIVISVSIILGAILLTAKTDREYISLEPTEGISSGIVLEETKEYTQRFTANRDSITRVGIHLRPITPHIPDVKIPITLTNSQGETVSAAIPAIFIDKQSATEVRFNPPLETTPGNPVVMTIGVPSELSGKVRIQTRVQDDTFDATYATFLIDNEIQENPLAYRVSYQHRPAIIIQIGLLLVLGGMYHVTRHAKKTILLIFALPAIYITPALIANQLPITFYIILLTALSVSFFIFRKNTSQIAALTGASVFSFTSWWPLQRYL